MITLCPCAKSSNLRFLRSDQQPQSLFPCTLPYSWVCGLGRVHFGGTIILPTTSTECPVQFGELSRQLWVDTILVLGNPPSRKEADDCPCSTCQWEGVAQTSFKNFSSSSSQGYSGSSLKCYRRRARRIYWRESMHHASTTVTLCEQEGYPPHLKPSREEDFEGTSQKA